MTREVSGERDAFRGFFETLLGLDQTKRIYNMVWQRFPHEIRMLLDNPLHLLAVLGASQRRAR